MADHEHFVKLLSQQCLHYIAMHLEEFPVSQLSLLPVKTREELLWRLPIADLCQLEDTEFVTGIQDIAAYWKKPCPGCIRVPESICIDEDSDIQCYTKEWDETEYARALVYGQVASTAIELQGDEFIFFLSQGHLYEDDTVNLIPFLYGVRKPEDDHRCYLEIPHRYSHHQFNDDVIDTVLSCFKGELPKVFGALHLYDHDGDKLKHAHLLKYAVYIGIHGQPFRRKGLEFVDAVLKESRYGHLEVLVLEGLSGMLDEGLGALVDERILLDPLCICLSTHTSFLSNFRMLKILPGVLGHGFFVSQSCFDILIVEYFSARADHVQNIYFKNTKITSSEIHHPPDIDQRYLQYKTIELDNCQFVSKYKATSKSISHWLGQDISVIEKNEGSLRFKVTVDKKVSNVGKKRKFSELVYSSGN